jgi:hypothetical protein
MDYRLLLLATAFGLACASPAVVRAQATSRPGGAPGLMMAPSGLANTTPPLANSTPPLANSTAALANLRNGLPFNATGNSMINIAPQVAPVPPSGMLRR